MPTKTGLRRLTLLSVSAFGLWVGCGAFHPPEPPRSTPAAPASVAIDAGEAKAEAADPIKLAWEYAELGKQRLEHIPSDPKLNGFYDLILIGNAKGGILDLWTLAKSQGDTALLHRLSQTDDDSSLMADMAKVELAVSKQTVAAPVDMGNSGPIKVKNSAAFVKIVNALSLIPLGDSDNPDLPDRLGTYLFALRAARAVSLNATTVEHYDLGIGLQTDTLTRIAKTIKLRKLKSDDLRGLIARIQEQRGGVQEMLDIVDAEYFVAMRHLDGESLESQALRKEKTAISARYLTVRPYFQEATPPEKGFVSPVPVPEMRGAPLASKEPDFMQSLGRSRLAATQMGSIEILAGLEARKLEKGSYPAKVDELVPAFLSRMPLDYLSDNGKFRYAKTSKGYTLETVTKALPSVKSGRIAW